MTREQNPGTTPGDADRNPAPDQERVEDTLAAQYELLKQLRLWSDELRTLTDRECELEVEIIATEAAHKAPLRSDVPGLDEAKAGVIAEAMARKPGLAGGPPGDPGPHKRTGGKTSKRELARLREAQEALGAWLEAPAEVKRREMSPLTQALFGLALLACIWAGLTFHLAFLVLLIPLGMPFSFLALGSHDLSWVRLGMRRRFEATGLDPPAAWKAPAVAARRAEIERSLQLARQQPAGDAEPGDVRAFDGPPQQAEPVQAESSLRQLMADAGLDAEGVNEELKHWLEREAAVRRTRRELGTVQAKRRALSREADAVQQALYRFLSGQGEAPPQGRADLDALTAGLERVRKKSAC